MLKHYILQRSTKEALTLTAGTVIFKGARAHFPVLIIFGMPMAAIVNQWDVFYFNTLTEKVCNTLVRQSIVVLKQRTFCFIAFHINTA